MPAINLGLPKVPETLAPRRKTRQIQVGKVGVGSDHQVSVQSMTTTQTTNINATLQQIADLETRWTAAMIDLSRVPKDADDDAFSEQFEPLLEKFFRTDRELATVRRRFLESLEDIPGLRAQLDPVAGTIRRLDRISERVRMIEEPEKFPDQVDLAKLRESKESIATLLRETNAMADAVLREKDRIDQRLAAVVENFAPERIDPVDRAILRLATWEILHAEKVPAPVAIDEAIELAKRFGTTDSGRFVNGVLDKIAKQASAAG